MSGGASRRHSSFGFNVRSKTYIAIRPPMLNLKTIFILDRDTCTAISTIVTAQ